MLNGPGRSGCRQGVFQPFETVITMYMTIGSILSSDFESRAIEIAGVLVILMGMNLWVLCNRE